jgi:hypothetical protein
MFKFLQLLQVELRHTNSQKHDIQEIYKKGMNFVLEVTKGPGNLSQQAEAQKVLKDLGLDCLSRELLGGRWTTQWSTSWQLQLDG